MRKITRTLLVAVGATLALGSVSACSPGTGQSPSATAIPTSAAAPTLVQPFPRSAKFIADMSAAGGKTMTIGIAVDDGSIAAYACNGVDDEAWFFGDQSDGKIAVTGKFRDTLNASFDGTDMVGDLTMNGQSYRFTAAPVAAPAGMYTGAVAGVRATWVVRPGDSATGVEHRPGVTPATDPTALTDEEFRASVRNARVLGPAAPILSLGDGSGTAEIDGQVVTLQVVDGNFRL